MIQVGLNRMYIVCGPYFLCGIMDVMTGVLRGVGYSLLPMIVSLMGACVFRIFWVMTIFAVNRTMDCLMISYPVSWALTFLVLVVIFAVLWKRRSGRAIRRRNWRRDKTAKPADDHSVVFFFSADKERNAAGCMSSPLGALKCVPLFLKGLGRFDKPEVGL